VTTSQSRKYARRARRLSTGHGRARSSIALSSQFVRRSAAYQAARWSYESDFTGTKHP